MTLPIADPWYDTCHIAPNIWLITEPRVHPIFSANMHLVTGRDADLLIDSGMGIAPLRPVVDKLRGDAKKPLILLSSHTHVDHIGAAHEFETRLVHPVEAEEQAAPSPYSLVSADIPAPLAAMFVEAGYAPLWEYLVDAVPYGGYDLAAYEIKPAPATGTVEDGDIIDLGDWQAEVLHLPGHSPGQLGLWHGESGTLFGGDAVYDGPLIYDGAGMSIDDYAATLKRLRALSVEVVHGGHDPAFGRARLHEMIDDYLALWGKSG
ncbi:MBL fold metallo-hydrolase [Rhodalgimonas zhirmunskyi]|uniref:MBL fold metallo-hydrolase n=1 Tax=Rhodalgimonas zhirmunskyi TaxID=2964767 RepID=A0AAJ1X4L3_9RHOB|nr:MBL fold metallo-hydrolase [Rhodoalgimonas zhirmunskyi]MDQ2093636.1 MBL fold metallo-hydrolase [Rhodoalgimonas zhirmunskyi]